MPSRRKLGQVIRAQNRPLRSSHNNGVFKNAFKMMVSLALTAMERLKNA